MSDRSQRPSWLANAEASGFGASNLPYGVVRRPDGETVVAVRLGECALDLLALLRAGELSDIGIGQEVLTSGRLNELIALGPAVWRSLRTRLCSLLDPAAGTNASTRNWWAALLPLGEVEEVLAIEVPDYVDFYSSIHHATNAGKILRPNNPGLLPNWRHLPVGYHGRAGSIVRSGTRVRRPLGQRRSAAGTGPTFGPSRQLDFELELGLVVGRLDNASTPLTLADAERQIFGVVLVNDWSARDIQQWEGAPLGPFLGKSFATSISNWVVPFAALAACRTPAPPQDPQVLGYLREDSGQLLDIELRAILRPPGAEPTTISATNARHLYWTPAQQLCHATSNGATMRPGDLYASGTVSGPNPESLGCLLELSWGGARPLTLSDGSTRSWLLDGDEVTLEGHTVIGRDESISLGPVTGAIAASVR